MSFLKNNKEKIFSILVWTLIFSIPFGLRRVFYVSIEQLGEFGSIFIYVTDLLLLTCVILGFFILKQNKAFCLSNRIFFISLFIFLLIGGFSVFFSSEKIISLVNFIRLVFLAGFALVIAEAIRGRIIKAPHLMVALGLSAVFQSGVALLQFFKQSSLGLGFLGEPMASIYMSGVAKTFADDLLFLRVFGTMPHANILAAFLVVGFLSLIFLYLKEEKIIKRSLVMGGMFLVLSALVLTFSRSGWIILLISVAGLLFFVFKQNKQKLKEVVIVALVCATFLFAALGWLIYPRAGFMAGEPSVDHRIVYNQIGLDIIKNNPLGIGLGNFTNYAESMNMFSERGLVRQYNRQPVHNLYLLIASELGILGLLVFLFFVGYAIFKFVRALFLKLPDIGLSAILLELKRVSSLPPTVPILMIISVLLFGFVDYFMWTMQAGQLMFWLSLGMILGNLNLKILCSKDLVGAESQEITSRSRSSMDRTQASGA